MKKILIYSSTSLYPKIMASQDRIINMIKVLSNYHIVDLVMLYRDEKEIIDNKNELGKYLNRFYPIKAINPKKEQLKRKFYGVLYKLYSIISGLPTTYFYQNSKQIKTQIKRLIEENEYDIIQIEYWYFAGIFKVIQTNAQKVIDMHMISFDDLKNYAIEKYGKGNIPKRVRKNIEKTKNKEIEVLNNADLLLTISAEDHFRLKKFNLKPKTLLIPIGQNIDYFSSYPIKKEENTVIFYGSMGGKQNIIAFNRFWKSIYPHLKEKCPNIKLIIIGANPSKEIKNLEKSNSNVIVTGFVDDVREFLAKGQVLIIPLEVGVGFRGRIIDVMAMKIPVVGTHNALDCIEMEHGKHGYISDNDEEMANYLFQILNDDSLQQRLSKNCLEFVKEKYSLEATYGALSEYYSKID